jgi:hypothetical protein
VTTLNSRRKGKRGENEFITRHLLEHWPEAKRNLDQFGDDCRDVLNVAGCHWQIKRTERLDLWAAIEQADREAAPTDTPLVAFRRNRSRWYCVIEADELVALLRLREQA